MFSGVKDTPYDGHDFKFIMNVGPKYPEDKLICYFKQPVGHHVNVYQSRSRGRKVFPVITKDLFFWDNQISFLQVIV